MSSACQDCKETVGGICDGAGIALALGAIGIAVTGGVAAVAEMGIAVTLSESLIAAGYAAATTEAVALALIASAGAITEGVVAFVNTFSEKICQDNGKC